MSRLIFIQMSYGMNIIKTDTHSFPIIIQNKKLAVARPGQGGDGFSGYYLPIVQLNF